MASPSGRTCEDSTKRCRLRISSAMRARVAVSVAAVAIVSGLGTVGVALRAFALRIFFVDVLEDSLDAVLVRDRLVEPELELRHAAKMRDARADLPAEKAGGAPQRLRRVLARLLIAEAGVEDARDL